MARFARLQLVVATIVLTLSAAAAGAPARPVIVVGVDTPGHPLVHYVAARANRDFRDRDYELRFQVFSRTALRSAFVRGDVDVMVAAVGDLPGLASARGSSVSLFAPLERWTPGPMILVPRGSRATRLADLKGLTVAIAPRARRTGHEEAAVLAAAETPMNRFLKLRQGDDPDGALARREVNAAFVESAARGLLQTGRYRVVFSVQQAYRKAFSDPAVLRTGLVADARLIQLRPDAVADLREAIQAAWKRYAEDPAAVAREGSRWGRVSERSLTDRGETLQLGRLTPAAHVVTERDRRTWTRLFPLIAKAEGGTPPTTDQIRDFFVVSPAAKG